MHFYAVKMLYVLSFSDSSLWEVLRPLLFNLQMPELALCFVKTQAFE